MERGFSRVENGTTTEYLETFQSKYLSGILAFYVHLHSQYTGHADTGQKGPFCPVSCYGQCQTIMMACASFLVSSLIPPMQPVTEVAQQAQTYDYSVVSVAWETSRPSQQRSDSFLYLLPALPIYRELRSQLDVFEGNIQVSLFLRHAAMQMEIPSVLAINLETENWRKK